MFIELNSTDYLFLVWKLYITTTYSEIFMVAATMVRPWRRYLKYIKITGSTGKFVFSIFLENKSVLEANFFSAYNTSTGASKYIKIVKIHYLPNFHISQNFVVPLSYKMTESKNFMTRQIIFFFFF